METKHYDIVLSCAEEDLGIANQIGAALKHTGLSYYLYTEHRADNWGRDIFQISWDKYRNEAVYILMLISKWYVIKKWSDIERQISQLPGRPKPVYILPLRLDQTLVDGLSSNIVFEEWNNNAEELAELIKKKIGQSPDVGQQIKDVSGRENIFKAEKQVNNTAPINKQTNNL